MVRDHLLDIPASLGGQLLVDRPFIRAMAACEILNRIYSSGLDVRGRSGTTGPAS